MSLKLKAKKCFSWYFEYFLLKALDHSVYPLAAKFSYQRSTKVKINKSSERKWATWNEL